MNNSLQKAHKSLKAKINRAESEVQIAKKNVDEFAVCTRLIGELLGEKNVVDDAAHSTDMEEGPLIPEGAEGRLLPADEEDNSSAGYEQLQ